MFKDLDIQEEIKARKAAYDKRYAEAMVFYHVLKHAQSSDAIRAIMERDDKMKASAFPENVYEKEGYR